MTKLSDFYAILARQGMHPASVEDPALYCQDESGLRADGSPAAVLRPVTVAEAAEIMRACHAARMSVTLQGGRTGLAGGAVPDPGDIVLSTERLNRIESIDATGGTATVEAGVTLQALCDAAAELGWYFPMDSGARSACQIGGAIATNMGGNRVLRYGTMRALVLGLEVILPDGERVRSFGYGLKNNTGVDLKQLFIGSEGTLGLITRAVLRLFPQPTRRQSALLALPTAERLPTLLRDARAALPTLSSFEVMWRDYLQAAAHSTGLQAPFEGKHPITVLLETESFSDSERQATELHEFLETQLDRSTIVDAILPHSEAQAADLWRLRDAIGEILPRIAPCVAFDIGIPLHQLTPFIDGILPTLERRWPKATRLLFGHLGDGNLHLSIGPLPTQDLPAVETCVYEAVAQFHGSISAEHGIGRIKKPFLHFSRSPRELELMRQIKTLFDGAARVNRGRILNS
ncbi:FAD-binding oxidoreductase [Castellaniella caeni]|uniref:FAD-binding oxidoreductase n=1 Tax=Castellaniella caeni TaxID=266123 RepID=UPI000835C8F4|nr:FAD-binding oxidoreductase [Castellaniella caeni]